MSTNNELHNNVPHICNILIDLSIEFNQVNPDNTINPINKLSGKSKESIHVVINGSTLKECQENVVKFTEFFKSNIIREGLKDGEKQT